MAGPRYSSEFHQYEGHDVEQQAHRMHSYRPSSLRRSALVWRYSLPYPVVSGPNKKRQGTTLHLEGRAGELWDTYVWGRGVSLQVGLDGLVLLVEEGEIRHKILDDVGMREGVDLRLSIVLGIDTAWYGC